jgi:hypothetical protein
MLLASETIKIFRNPIGPLRSPSYNVRGRGAESVARVHYITGRSKTREEPRSPSNSLESLPSVRCPPGPEHHGSYEAKQ